MEELNIPDIIINEYSKQFNIIKSFLELKNGNILFAAHDPLVLSTFISQIMEYAHSKGHVYKNDCTAASQIRDNVNLYIINLDTYKDQRSLYAYLDRSRVSISLILYSTSVKCLDKLEKRVRSRFEHRVVFLPFLNTEQYAKYSCGENACGNTSIASLCAKLLKSKHTIKDVCILDIYKILSMAHIAILILSKVKSVTNVNLIKEFKKFNNQPALKAVENKFLSEAFSDLIDISLIDVRGGFSGDWEMLRKYILEVCPVYVQNLLREIN